MRAILNVDMEGLTPEQVWAAMYECGIVHGGNSRHYVNAGYASWDTLAVYVRLPGSGFEPAQSVDKLARLLGQNCIAVYDLDFCKGALVGPDTSKYEPFSSGLFRVV